MAVQVSDVRLSVCPRVGVETYERFMHAPPLPAEEGRLRESLRVTLGALPT